jgi:imidazolonepropionase-like amidohydrolase
MKPTNIAAALCCTILMASAFAEAAPPPRTWIADVTIVSPEKLDHVETGSVLIENDRIARVERKKGVKPPPGVSVVSGKGQFLIPGLIDSHVHVASIPGMSFPQESANPDITQQYLRQLPRSYLYFGYTTLIDLVVVDRGVLQGFRDAPLHPDLFDCGAPLVFANGYPMMYAPTPLRFKLFPNFLYDPRQASAIPPEFKAEDQSPAAGIARVKESGGICIKTFYERGFGGQHDLPVMGPEIFADIRKAANDARLPLLVHANSYEAQKFAVDGGADVIAHGMWNWGDFDGNPELPVEVKAVLDNVVKNKIGYQPTIQVMQGLRAYFDPDYLKRPEIPKVIPQVMLDWFNSPAGKWFKATIGDKDVPDAVMFAGYERGPITRVRQVVTYLAARDAKFLFGTDTPSAPTYGNLPGLNGYLEMQQLKSAGMSLAQIFKAATLSNAREFRLDSQVGTIEPGKLANLVLLKKSPLQSLEAYDSISTVWLHGTAIPRDDLAADARVKAPAASGAAK